MRDRTTPFAQASDIGAMAAALAMLLEGDDAPLPADVRIGLAVVLEDLAKRAEALADQLLGADLDRAA